MGDSNASGAKRGDQIGRLSRQHDGNDALGDDWVRRIGGMHCQCRIVIIDLEKDGVALGFERAKVVFFVWIVLVAKVVKDFDGLDDARDRFAPSAAMPIVITA